MNSYRIFIRSYCHKKFTLPKIDFKYSEPQDLEKEEWTSSKRFPQYIKNSSKFTHQRSNVDFQKNIQDNHKQEFKIENKSRPRYKSGTYSEKNRHVSEFQDSNVAAYSCDLLEIDDTKILTNKKVNRYSNLKHPRLDHFKHSSKHNPDNLDKYYILGKGQSESEQSNFSRKKSSEIIYGIFPVLLALQAKRRSFYKLYLKNVLNKNEKIQQIYKICQMNNITTQVVEKRVLRQLTSNDAVHQGVCLSASPLPITMEDESQLLPVTDCGRKLRLYLNEINDPMNVGAILRTAYLLGVEKVLCSFDNSCPITSVVSKASAGIAEVFPIHTVSMEESYILASKNAGWQILSSSSPSNVNCMNLEDFQPSKNILLIIGNEGRGITQELIELSDVCISIPPHERCSPDLQTLNASAASSILIYSLMSKLK